MDHIEKVLDFNGRKKPAEMERVKKYILVNYGEDCGVKLQHGTLVVAATSASLAATLHVEKQKIISECNVDLPLRFVIKN